MNNVFVTVGTTQFEKLISIVMSDDFLKVLYNKGCRKLTLQVGQGTLVPLSERLGICVECFPLKPSIADEISRADLVISHAGAGSCLAVLGANKPLLVVTNDDLMDNHQQELADRLCERGHLAQSDCTHLIECLSEFDPSRLRPYDHGDPRPLADQIDRVMGFTA